MSGAIWSEDCEAAVLGAALSHPAAAAVIVGVCTSEDFYLDRHRRVLAEIARMVAAGERPDAVRVAMELPPDDRVHVISLPGRCPAAVSARFYAERLVRVTARRRLASVIVVAASVLDGCEGGGGLSQELHAELLAAAHDSGVLGEGET